MSIEPRARRRFAYLLFASIGAYAVFAAVLSWQVIEAQATVRNNLSIALDSLDFLHKRQMELDGSDANAHQQTLLAWKDYRALWLAGDAARWSQALLQEWNAVAATPACGAPGAAFVLGPAPQQAAQRACHVYIQVLDHRLQVTGYDTQGAAMDNFYESLYPFRIKSER
jgi:hypothetical protein